MPTPADHASHVYTATARDWDEDTMDLLRHVFTDGTNPTASVRVTMGALDYVMDTLTKVRSALAADYAATLVQPK